MRRNAKIIEELKGIERLLGENPPKVMNARYLVRRLIERAEVKNPP